MAEWQGHFCPMARLQLVAPALLVGQQAQAHGSQQCCLISVGSEGLSL